MNIAIVTPWQNHLELAEDYFEAVLPEMEDGDRNIIVDDCSDPPLAFASIFSSERIGFCGASNVGLAMADTDAVLFLNNDIRRMFPGWLNPIREALEPGVLAGSLRFGAHANVDGIPMPYLDGWCLAGMREDLTSIGGFDETLQEPAYYSDNLLCLEARAAGMTLREVSVGLVHKENSTAGPAWDERVRAATNANKVRYETRARELLIAA